MSAPPHKEHVPPATPGDRIGRYRILNEIGQGGMGVVFRAHDLELERDVAIKFPWAERAGDERSRRRFLREAHATSRLNHPHIVQVIDAFEHRDMPCLVLQLIDGVDLQTLIARDGRLACQRVLELSEGLGGALGEAHSQRILHRDVNPRNILVARDDRALLTDFGLARHLPEADLDPNSSTRSGQITGEGQLVGTPRYMSPEQVLGRELDERSDLYALGTVMYEMCTGTPAVTATEIGAIYDQVLHAEPQPIPSFTYETPAELERVIRKLMAKRPDERYQGARELLADLKRLRRVEDYRDYTTTLAADRPAPRSPRRSIAWWLLLAACVAIVLVVWRYPRAARDAVPRARPIQVTNSEAWEGSPAISPDGSQIAYVSDASGNLDIYVIDVGGDVPLRLTDDPADDEDPFWFPDGTTIGFASDRGGAWSAWKVGRHGGGATMLVPDAGTPAIDPAGRRLAYATFPPEISDRRIAVCDLSDPASGRILTDDSGGLWSHVNPAWSPDGDWICYEDQHALWLVPSSGGAARRLTRGRGPDFHPAWSPSGKRVYFTSGREGTQAIWRVEVESGLVERVTMGTGPESRPDVSRDGTRLAYLSGTSDRTVVLVDRRSGEAVELPEVSWTLSLSPGLERVVYSRRGRDGGSDLWELRLVEGRPAGRARQITDHAGISTQPAISPDGRWIAYYHVDAGRRDIWVLPAAGGAPVSVTDGEATHMHPAWSPDGAMLAYIAETDDASRIWSVPVREGRATGEPRAVSPPTLVTYAPAWSDDGSSIACIGMVETTAEIFVLPAAGGEARQLTHGSEAMRVHWDPTTGRILASGLWGSDRYTLRSVDPLTGSSEPLEPAVEFGGLDARAAFDLSNDGTWLVYPRWRQRGDLWVLDADEGSY
jgi:Tol biopolymer transport system component